MAEGLRADSGQPIIEMNTTPLIDVLLVLLIMFIITIPVQSHAVKLDLPQPCVGCPPVDPLRNEIRLTRAGAILWNGHVIGADALRHLLARTQRIQPLPELHLRPDADARYELVDEVLAITKRARVQKMGFVGNERYGHF